MLKIRIPIFLGLFALTIVSCIDDYKSKSIVNDPPTPITTEQSAENDSLANTVGLFIEESIYQSNAQDYLSKFYFERFGELATYSPYQQNGEREFKKGFLNGFKKGVKDIPNRIFTTIDQGGFYDYLHYFYDETQKRYKVLFRLFSEVDGINYHEYQLVKKGDEFLFDDMYVFMTGENLSATTNRIYLGSLPKNVFNKLVNPTDSKDIENFTEATKYIRQGDGENALIHLNKIEGKLRNDKIYHVLKISVNAQMEEKIYLETLENMKDTFGDDPTMNLLSVDYFILNQDYDKAMEILDNIETATNDDFINYLKGNVKQLQGKQESAISYYDIIIENYPEYSTAFTNKMVSLNLLGKFDACLQIMDDLIQRDMVFLEDMIGFVEEVDVNGENVLSPLVNSVQYKNWKAKKQPN